MKKKLAPVWENGIKVQWRDQLNVFHSLREILSWLNDNNLLEQFDTDILEQWICDDNDPVWIASLNWDLKNQIILTKENHEQIKN